MRWGSSRPSKAAIGIWKSARSPKSVAHKEDGPAVLFEDIKGYPKGYRVLSNSLSSRKRLALTLGLPAGETKMDFVKIWKDNYKNIKPIPAKFVKKSGLFDNVV